MFRETEWRPPHTRGDEPFNDLSQRTGVSGPPHTRGDEPIV